MPDDPIDESGRPPSAVDDFIHDPWDPAAIASLAKWSQGCLVPGSIFGYATDDPGSPPGSPLSVEAVEFDPDSWMIVLTQTCDIMLTATGGAQPFVMCSPLIDISARQPNQVQSIKDWSVTYLAPVPGVPRDNLDERDWAADLRVAMPVHKLVLVDCDIISGYSDERGRLRFADFVAQRTRRPALHDALSSDLRKILDDTIAGGPKTDRGWWEAVEQIRLEIRPGRLEPDWVSIHIFCDRALTAEEQAHWRAAENRIKKLFAEHHITFGLLRFDCCPTSKQSTIGCGYRCRFRASPVRTTGKRTSAGPVAGDNALALSPARVSRNGSGRVAAVLPRLFDLRPDGRRHQSQNCVGGSTHRSATSARLPRPSTVDDDDSRIDEVGGPVQARPRDVDG